MCGVPLNGGWTLLGGERTKGDVMGREGGGFLDLVTKKMKVCIGIFSLEIRPLSRCGPF